MRHLPRARIERPEGGAHPAGRSPRVLSARAARAVKERAPRAPRAAASALPPFLSLSSVPLLSSRGAAAHARRTPQPAPPQVAMANHSMDPTKFKKDMGALAFGSALGAAARDYKAVRGAARRGAVGVARERRAWWLWRCDVGTCHALGRGRAWQAPCAAAGEPGHSCSRAPRRMPRPRIEREHLRVGMARAVAALPSCASGDRRLRTGERARVSARTRCASADARTLPVACTRAFARLQQMEAEENAQAYVKAYQQVAIDEELGDVRARRAATLASSVQKSARAATVARCATCLASACAPVFLAARREARRRAELTAAFATHPRAHAPSRRRRPSRSCRSAA